MWRKGSRYRIEYPEYPERAVQEAVVNALIHRDYSIIGSEVHIDIYDDRLEVSSPSGMADGSLAQETDPYKVVSNRRNPVLADLFGRMDLMERRGSGFKKIIEAYISEENYKPAFGPTFQSTGSHFLVVLQNLNIGSENDTQSDTQKLKLVDRRRQMVAVMVQDPRSDLARIGGNVFCIGKDN